MRCTIAFQWTGRRYLVVIHHCVEWFNPHGINVSIQHNPLRSYVGDVCLFSHQWGKQTLHRDWKAQTATEITNKYSCKWLRLLVFCDSKPTPFTIFPLSSCRMDESKQFISVHCLGIKVIPHRLPFQVCIGFMENPQYLKNKQTKNSHFYCFLKIHCFNSF